MSRQVTGPDGTLYNNNGSGVWSIVSTAAGGDTAVPASDGGVTYDPEGGVSITLTPTPLPDSVDQQLAAEDSKAEVVFTES